METFFDSARKFFEPLSTAQKMLFGLFSVLIISSVVALFFWASRPDYALLFGSLDSSSAQTIVEDLKSEGINYELRNEGTTIMVPERQVHDLRLKYASEGTAGQNMTGYELFDSSTLGMTSFMQKVNLKRALEGELSRTVSALSQVDFARVHLVMPERSPFEESDVEASASVITNLKPNEQLSQDQIKGIASLVSGSVEQLEPKNVTILDQNGNQISNNSMLDSEFAASSAQMEHRKNSESYLAGKAQSMLDRLVGSGNSIVRVSTQHDFEQIERNSQLIDPDSRIIISEERKSERTSNTEGQPMEFDEFTPPALRGETVNTLTQNKESETKVRNYEVNTTQEHYKKPVGQITRLSASVMLNHEENIVAGSQGQDSVVYEPYTPQEMADIRSVVASAIGYTPGRGDELTVTQFRFDRNVQNIMREQQQVYQEQQEFNQYLRWSLIALALVAALALVYTVLSRLFPEQVPPLFRRREIESKQPDETKTLPKDKKPAEQKEGEEEDLETELDKETDMYRSKLSPEAKKQLQLKNKMFEEIKNFSEFKPDEAANLARSMMVKEEED